MAITRPLGLALPPHMGAFLDAENVYAVDGPSTLDVRVRRPFKRHTFFVDALNVTGNVYEEYGFTLADFSGRPTPYAYPGAPRMNWDYLRARVIAAVRDARGQWQSTPRPPPMPRA